PNARATAVNQSGYGPGQAKRSGGPHDDADQGDLQSLSQHHLQDVSSGRTKRHSDSNFVRAVAGQIGNHAVDSDGGKNESKRVEHAEEKHGQPLRGNRTRNDFFHGPDIIEGRAAYDFFGGLSNGACDVSRVVCCSGDIPAAIGQKRPKPVGDLPNRKIEVGLQVLMLPRTETPVFDVTDDADDLRLHSEQSDVEVVSDGSVIGKILAGE